MHGINYKIILIMNQKRRYLSIIFFECAFKFIKKSFSVDNFELQLASDSDDLCIFIEIY